MTVAGIVAPSSLVANGAVPELLPVAGRHASLLRVWALMRRFIYLLRGSGVRIVELFYWPFLQMLTWGYLQKYLLQHTDHIAMAAGALIGSVLLWDILYRSSMGFSVTFTEEMWSRNLGVLLTSPLRPIELIAGLSLWSIVRLILGMAPVIVAAYLVFDFNILKLGLPLAAFFSVLILTGWALGLLIAAIILRFGLGAQSFAWSLTFLLLPLCCVYYPVTVLPDWLQPIALALPPTHVFEGMRSILLYDVFDQSELWWAVGLCAVYIIVSYVTFHRALASAKVHGGLLHMGE